MPLGFTLLPSLQELVLLEKEQELLEKEQTLSILREEVRCCCAAWQCCGGRRMHGSEAVRTVAARQTSCHECTSG